MSESNSANSYRAGGVGFLRREPRSNCDEWSGAVPVHRGADPPEHVEAKPILLRASERTLRQVSKNLGVSYWSLREWYRKAEMTKKQQSTLPNSGEGGAALPELGNATGIVRIDRRGNLSQAFEILAVGGDQRRIGDELR
jgi:hypothetical protein